MKGIYVLFLELNESQQILVGRRGLMKFNKGFYAYVGSALNSLESRVKRHLGNKKKHFWHIDYLLDKAFIREVVLIPSDEKLECRFATAIGESLFTILHFGSSDCHCTGHLFFSIERDSLEKVVMKALTEFKIEHFRVMNTPSSNP